jgi:hypothetical protein
MKATAPQRAPAARRSGCAHAGGARSHRVCRERLELVTRRVQAMSVGALVQTPALYDRLDWELSKLLHWRSTP